MSQNVALSIDSLSSALVDAADTAGIIDTLIDKLIIYLNKRKLRKAEDYIRALERRAEEYETAKKQIDLQIKALEARIEELESDKRFRKGDLKTLGIRYLIRYGWASLRQDWLKDKQSTFRDTIAHISTTNQSIAHKVEVLKEQLERMKEQKNPSLLARILSWIKFIKNLIMLVANVIAGKVIGALSSLYGSIKSAAILDAHMAPAYVPTFTSQPQPTTAHKFDCDAFLAQNRNKWMIPDSSTPIPEYEIDYDALLGQIGKKRIDPDM